MTAILPYKCIFWGQWGQIFLMLACCKWASSSIHRSFWAADHICWLPYVANPLCLNFFRWRHFVILLFFKCKELWLHKAKKHSRGIFVSCLWYQKDVVYGGEVSDKMSPCAAKLPLGHARSLGSASWAPAGLVLEPRAGWAKAALCWLPQAQGAPACVGPVGHHTHALGWGLLMGTSLIHPATVP